MTRRSHEVEQSSLLDHEVICDVLHGRGKKSANWRKLDPAG